jgi:hypothetical protein
MSTERRPMRFKLTTNGRRLRFILTAWSKRTRPLYTAQIEVAVGANLMIVEIV